MKARLLILCWLLSTILATGIGLLVITPGYRLGMILPIGIPIAIFGAILYAVIGIKMIDSKIKKIANETLGDTS